MNVDIDIPKHSVIQYVRHKGGKKKNVPFGVIVGVKLDGGFGIGYSLCNKKDRFNKKMALKIALGRAGELLKLSAAAPHEVSKMIPAFVDRCKRYYKV